VVVAGLFGFSAPLFSGLLVAVSCYKVEALCGTVVRCCCAVFVGFLAMVFCPYAGVVFSLHWIVWIVEVELYKVFYSSKKKKKKLLKTFHFFSYSSIIYLK
jgi:hypothetical protein